MLDDVLPVRRVVVAAQVGLKLAAKDLQRGTLADTVGSNQAEHLSRSGHGQAVELEAVGAIAVGHLALEVRGQVDDGDGVEGALLGADAAADTERLGNEGEARIGGDFDAELAAADDGARLFALLTALARATLRAVSIVARLRGVVGGRGRRRTLSLFTMAILEGLLSAWCSPAARSPDEARVSPRSASRTE